VPKATIARQVEAFIAQTNAAVIATPREDGSPHTVATWYD
jgi:hypothetical protein